MIYTTFFAILTALSLTSATPVKRAEAFLIRAKGSPDNVSPSLVSSPIPLALPLTGHDDVNFRCNDPVSRCVG